MTEPKYLIWSNYSLDYPSIFYDVADGIIICSSIWGHLLVN